MDWFLMLKSLQKPSIRNLMNQPQFLQKMAIPFILQEIILLKNAEEYKNIIPEADKAFVAKD
jgi:hypothetical protein